MLPPGGSEADTAMAADAHNKVRVPATQPANLVLLSPKPLIPFMMATALAVQSQIIY